MYFSHPFGFLGLLAVPVIILIHMLREKSRRLVVSTLFLLETLPPRTPQGRMLHVLQSSLPFWMQLLVALLCTWLLAGPRWIRRDSYQRVGMILDDTASMSAFREEALRAVADELGKAGHGAAHTEWTMLLASQPEKPLYRGESLRDALASLQGWRPALPHFDPARAFSLAQIDYRAGGAIYFATDHQPESLPTGIALLACGHPIDNCGFAGVRTWTEADGPHWEALVRNSGAKTQKREFWLETEKARSQPQTVELQPGQIATLPGPFPPGEKRITLHLSPDAFTLDDTLPLVAPEPKPLEVFLHTAPEMTRFAERVLATVPGARKAAEVKTAAVSLVPVAEVARLSAGQSAIVFAEPAAAGAKAVLGGFTAERHPYTDGLIWDGLLSPGPGNLQPQRGDLTLVWQGEQPLIFLHSEGASKTLYLNFDFAASNAGRLPPFVLLFTRFLQDVQKTRAARFAANFETHEALPNLGANVKLTAGGAPLPVERADLRAPTEPGFFQARDGETEVLDAAAHFGDVREADFQQAISAAPRLTQIERVRAANSSGDPWATLWVALIGVALTLSWKQK